MKRYLEAIPTEQVCQFTSGNERMWYKNNKYSLGKQDP